MRVRGLEGSSGLRVRGVERSSASSRAFECEGSREGYIALAGARGMRKPAARLRAIACAKIKATPSKLRKHAHNKSCSTIVNHT